MIIYNVTVNVDSDIHEEWLKWMHDVHIPRVMQTGMFQSWKIMKVLSRQEDERGVTYAVQYRAASMQNYLRYRDEFAQGLQAETLNKYGEKVMAFRTLMEEI